MPPLSLFDASGQPTLTPVGPFGAAARDAELAADLIVYELLTPAGSVPGRTAGTDLSDELIAAANTFDITTAVSAAVVLTLPRLGTVPASQLPVAQRPSNVTLAGLASTDGRVSVRLAVQTPSGLTATRNVALEVGPE